MRNDVRVDWTIPPTPPGAVGVLERFIGPGTSRAEYLVQLVGGVLGIGLLALCVERSGVYQDWSAWQTIVVVIIALDLVGGVLTNATNAAKRWYHRALGLARTRVLFVSAHMLHLVAFAYVVLPARWDWLLLNTVVLLISTAAVELVPIEVKRPTGMAAYLAAFVLNAALVPLQVGLIWFVVLFYLKLLVGHLVPEAPLVADRA